MSHDVKSPALCAEPVVASDGSDEGARSIRILAVSNTWLGANDYSFVRAFRRAGHSVQTVSDESFVPNGWNSRSLKIARRLLLPRMVADYERSIIAQAEVFRPELFFVFKGTYLTPGALQAVRSLGAIAINVYPDVSFNEHGPYIAAAMPHYDWVFTTKSFHVDRMKSELGTEGVSFLPHNFDPEVHRPLTLDDHDRGRYGCEATFIGTWSPEKEATLLYVRRALPALNLKIWGNQWERAGPELCQAIMGVPLLGLEYGKGTSAAAINIALLIEKRPDSDRGDMTTSRTFNIPASGGFMLHQRTDEAECYFAEGRDCAMFGSLAELVEKIEYYLAHPAERQAIAAAGLARCRASGYSVDDRAAIVLSKLHELSGQARRISPPVKSGEGR